MMENAGMNGSPTTLPKVWGHERVFWSGVWRWERRKRGRRWLKNETERGRGERERNKRGKVGRQKTENRFKNRFNRFLVKLRSKSAQKTVLTARKFWQSDSTDCAAVSADCALTDGAKAKTGSTGFYTGSTGFHQGETGWVAYSAGLLNQFPDIARKGYNST
jgi:hypothetical protein